MGEEIEVKINHGQWVMVSENPEWSSYSEFRIKPKFITKFQYAFERPLTMTWNMTSEYFLDDSDFKKSYSYTSKFFKVEDSGKHFQIN